MLRVVFGFKQAQRIKRLNFMRRWGCQLPLSARPAYGPFSRAGRHNSAV
jgi:hypothetical protein